MLQRKVLQVDALDLEHGIGLLVGGGLGKIGLGGFGQKKTKAICAIDARIIDIDTAEILGVAEGKGESQRESTSLTGGGGGWSGFGISARPD